MYLKLLKVVLIEFVISNHGRMYGQALAFDVSKNIK